MSSPDIGTIKQVYEHMWNASKAPLARGLIEPDPIPSEGGRNWGVSAIVRPTEPVLNRLEDAAKEVSELTGPEHAIYDASNLHITLRTLETYRSHVTEKDLLIRQYAGILKEIAHQSGPIRISYRGLTATRTSIIAQGWPLDDTFQTLRERFHKQLARTGLSDGPESNSIRQIAHTSLVVFGGSISSPGSLVDYIEANRTTNYGPTEITKIEIVKYKKSDTSVRIFLLGEIELGTH